MKKLNRRKAIREECLNCSGFQPGEVANCTITNCYLFPFRTGKGKQNAKERNLAIRNYCLEHCMNNQKREVKLCSNKECPLYQFKPFKNVDNY